MASKLTQLFDIRNVIGALMGIYGVILTIAGFAPGLLREREKGASNNPVDLYFGTEANWWVGLALIGVAACSSRGRALRPVRGGTDARLTDELRHSAASSSSS